MSQPPFSSLPLAAELLKNIDSLGYTHMTPIQAQSLPAILAGKDVIGQAKTGSGKTAAFGLGLLQALNVKQYHVQALVLCPTRELADQVAKEIRKLARTLPNVKVLTLCGGMPFGPQLASLEHGAHIVVGTPGRVEEHLRKAKLSLKKLRTLVLDEADRMLDMGFEESLNAIIEHVPQQRQTLLFSATYPAHIQSIAKRIMQQPEMVQVAATHADASIAQHFYQVNDEKHRFTALRLLLLQFQPSSAVVFCRTKRDTQAVADQLAEHGFSVAALHGDLEQRDRDQTLVRFANHSITVLVATDVAARGLDIAALDAVINYHIAQDPEVHVHRIGRTGRAGSKGVAYTLYNEREMHRLAGLETEIDPITDSEPLPPQTVLDQVPKLAPMSTLQISSGKKQKIRPGDILGALTGEYGVAGTQVGKIQLFDNWAYVAVQRDVAKAALKKLGEGKLKGRSVRVRRIG